MGFWYDLFVPGALTTSIQKKLDTPESKAAIAEKTYTDIAVSNFTGAAEYVGSGIQKTITGAATLAGSTALSFLKPLVPLIIVGIIVAISANVISKKVIKG